LTTIMAPSWMDKFIIREDVTTNKRRSTEVPAIEIHYTALAGYYRILRMKGDTRPRHEVKRKSGSRYRER
jgi:hypothetical protein